MVEIDDHEQCWEAHATVCPAVSRGAGASTSKTRFAQVLPLCFLPSDGERVDGGCASQERTDIGPYGPLLH
eukprot:1106924-Prymnesium_polylepis.1